MLAPRLDALHCDDIPPQEGSEGAGDSRQRRRRTGSKPIWRPSEVPEDSETIDYSSEPYDSIPRQLELQWRTYAQLHPKEASAVLRQHLQQQQEHQAGPGSEQQLGLQAGVIGAIDGVPVAVLEGEAHKHRPRGGLLGRGLGAWLPSASQLEQKLRAGLHVSAAAGQDGFGGPGAGHKAGGEVPVQGPVTAATAGGGGRGAADGRHHAAPALPEDCIGLGCRTGLAWRQEVGLPPDDIREALQASLERWHSVHRDALRPLRRTPANEGWLLSYIGPQLPPSWTLRECEQQRSNDCCTAGPRPGRRRGPLRWPRLLLRRSAPQPRVWQVVVEEQGPQPEPEAAQGAQRGTAARGGARGGGGKAGLAQQQREEARRSGGLHEAQRAAAALSFELLPGEHLKAYW